MVNENAAGIYVGRELKTALISQKREENNRQGLQYVELKNRLKRQRHDRVQTESQNTKLWTAVST